MTPRLVCYLTIAFAIHAFSVSACAETEDEALATAITLSKYSCEFSPAVDTPLLFLNFSIENKSTQSVYDLKLRYTLEYKSSDESRTKVDDELVVPKALSQWTKADRVLVTDKLKGSRKDYSLTKCEAMLLGFYKEIPVTKKRTVKTRTGEALKVEPDCKEDYARLQTMKGLARREYLDRLVKQQCVAIEPVYGMREEEYQAAERIWVLISPR